MEDQIVFFVLSLGLIALGVYFMFQKNTRPKSDRVMVEATVVGHETERSWCDGSTPGQTTTVSSFPVYEYTLNGKTYRASGSVGITIFTKSKYQIGNRHTVLINPANPKRIYTHEERNATAIIGAILACFGLVFLLIAF